MSAKSGSRELVWIGAGVLGLLAVFFAVLYFRSDRDPIEQIAFKTKRVELVNAMRLALAATSEAQNSVVMSSGEQDSQSFATQARAASAVLERGRTELEKLLKERGDSHEMELMDRVGNTLREFHQIDKQLLELAVQNSNRKAYKLAFGPAMKLLQEMDEALSHTVSDDAGSTSEKHLQVLQLAGDARIGALRMQVVLLPHIAEENDQKMDEFEARLAAEDRKIRAALASLSALLPPGGRSNIEIATSRYTDFEKLKSQIIRLSRQNTDLRAAAIALNEKRQAMLACQDALVALEHAIQAEPITSAIPSGRSPSPATP